MDFHPIFKALMRNKAALALIALQIALTLAIVCNSVFIIAERLGKMNRLSGLDEANLFTLASVGFTPNFSRSASINEDLQTLRALPGVVDATPINNLPLSGGGWSEGISVKPVNPTAKPDDVTSTSVYLTDDHGINTLGLRLIEGRGFKPEEITDRGENDHDWPTSMPLIITKALAEKLHPGTSAVGSTVYMGEQPLTVIGVVELLQAPWVGWNHLEQSVLVPQRVLWSEQRYLVRTLAGQRDQVMGSVEKNLLAANPGRIVRSIRDYDKIRNEAYRRDKAMTIILIAVIATLLTVTGLGIVGIASFWVTQRIKQIGTRRALGARRIDVLRYFQMENFLIVSIGLTLGALLTYGFNLWLMHHFDATRLAWYYVPIGALGLWALGQAAVFGPAARASRVAPAVATRSV